MEFQSKKLKSNIDILEQDTEGGSREKKNIHSGSGRDAVPKPPPEFQNLEWLDCHIKVVLHDPTFRATFRATALR